MGLFQFFRRKKKKYASRQVSSPSIGNNSSTSLNSYRGNVGSDFSSTPAELTPDSTPCTVVQIPELVRELAAAGETGSDRAARALRKLFAVSEHAVGASLEETRREMVAEGSLVPALLHFLERCRTDPKAVDPGSSAVLQQPQLYLALLVFNNISIPVANKRLIALDFNSVAVLSRLLCDDPSCHLVVIVLVNLTFCDAALRRDLVYADVDLLEALCFAFRVASLTQEQYAARKQLLAADVAKDAGRTAAQRLSALLASDQEYEREQESALSPWPLTREQMFPDTARWCVCALQNLTRPCKDAANPAAAALIRTGIAPHILRCIRVSRQVDVSFSSASTNDTPEPSDPDDIVNDPSTWVNQSAQDAALFVLMNLATDPSARKFLLSDNLDTVSLLVAIADCGKASDGDEYARSNEGTQLAKFQCMKARMALSYLVGSEGHFGQAKGRTGRSVAYDSSSLTNNSLLVSRIEAEQLIEALANTLHRRSKAGPGGYSAATFSLKYLLFAIRCLLTQPKNQEQIADSNMEILNALFMKVLGLRALQNVTYIDAEAAEYACFSLYLLSHYGFHACFLPYSLGKDYNVRSLVAKVLTCLKDLDDTTPATQHAASQLLLRVKYLICIDTDATKAGPRGSRRIAADYCLDSQLVTAARQVVMAERLHSGAKPRADVFNRAIVRGSNNNSSRCGGGAFDSFPSALHAVQELSFGSAKVRHVAAIDDIAIANNIANCADGKKAESYGFFWSWKDTTSAGEGNNTQTESRCHSLSMLTLAMGLPNLCGTDTTTNSY